MSSGESILRQVEVTQGSTSLYPMPSSTLLLIVRVRCNQCFLITHDFSYLSNRLLDIVHADQKLYLVFEFLEGDLKRYMENGNKAGRPITPAIVKVCPLIRPSRAAPTRLRRVSTRV